MSAHNDPRSTPDDSPEDNAGKESTRAAGGTPRTGHELPLSTDHEPIEKRIEVTPGQPVSFEVPANTNLVINVVNEKPQGFLSSLWSGCSCLLTGLVILVIVLFIVGSLSP